MEGKRAARGQGGEKLWFYPQMTQMTQIFFRVCCVGKR